MNIRGFALIAGIAVVFTFFSIFFQDAIYNEPRYENYCRINSQPLISEENINCTSIFNKTAYDICSRNKGQISYRYDSSGCPVESYCDFCYNDYEKILFNYSKNRFYIAALLGLIAILAGLYLPNKFEFIGSGFMFGGILVLIHGTARVFGSLDSVTRTIILGIELIILVFVGYKKLKK